jgi:hypothetical protein
MPPNVSARVWVLWSGSVRKNDGLDAMAASRNERLAVIDPESESEVLRLLSERRGNLVVAERTRAFKAACTGFRGTPCPAGCPERSRPAEPRTSCVVYGRRAPRLASASEWLRRSCATSAHLIERSRT